MNLYIQMGFSYVRRKTESIQNSPLGKFNQDAWKPSGGKSFRNEDFLKDGIGLVVFHQVEKDPFFDQQDRDSFP
jgi:hypothetical protein